MILQMNDNCRNNICKEMKQDKNENTCRSMIIYNENIRKTESLLKIS